LEYVLIKKDDLAIANLKFLLIFLELLLGLNIDFLKSEVIVIGTSAKEQARLVNLLICQVCSFPVTYLDLPNSDKKLSMGSERCLLKLSMAQNVCVLSFTPEVVRVVHRRLWPAVIGRRPGVTVGSRRLGK
jgi:hypothetical protein